MKKIGIIFITIIFLIGILIMPINAYLDPVPGLKYGIPNNLLTGAGAQAENCDVTISSSEWVRITTSGDGNTCYYSINSAITAIFLPEGRYKVGYITSSSDSSAVVVSVVSNVGDFIYSSSDGSAHSFDIDTPSAVYVRIRIPASANNSVYTISLRPYLIYDNDSVASISRAFSSVIQAPFTAIASGFNSLSSQIIGVDNLITPFGTVLVFIISTPLIVWGLNILIGFLSRPFKRR